MYTVFFSDFDDIAMLRGVLGVRVTIYIYIPMYNIYTHTHGMRHFGSNLGGPLPRTKRFQDLTWPSPSIIDASGQPDQCGVQQWHGF